VWLVNEDMCCLAERLWLTATFTIAGALSKMENAAKLCVFVCAYVCVFEMKQ